MAEKIHECQDECKSIYGYRRVHIWLERYGIHHNPKTVLRVMNKYSLLSVIRRNLNLFATVGALRSQTEAEIEKRFLRAFAENKGADIVEKVCYCRTFNDCANTNLKAVFELILQAAVQNHLPQKELPVLYIVSDMEFDSCTRGASPTNFEQAKKLYASCGYHLPQVVFWNVQSHNEQQPVKMNKQGVALVSGCTPRIFSQVVEGEMEPYKNMLHILMSERHAQISA